MTILSTNKNNSIASTDDRKVMVECTGVEP